MTVTIRQLARHISKQPSEAPTLRQLLKRENSDARIRVVTAPLSVMTYNMALLVFPASYLGTDRDGAVAEIVSRVTAFSPDVVGLCEVFSDGEREIIQTELASLYPHFREGPDEADLDSDGGLLLLSKHPVLQ